MLPVIFSTQMAFIDWARIFGHLIATSFVLLQASFNGYLQIFPNKDFIAIVCRPR
jgi:hypothetical protein